MKTLLRSILHNLARRAASSYVVGTELADAVSAARSFASEDVASTICYWDSEDDDPRQVADRYRSIMQAIDGENVQGYTSLKPWALQFSNDLIDEIFDFARQLDSAVHFDALLPEATEKTFTLIERRSAQGLKIGVTLPARWQRSFGDAERAVDLALRIRIVKGQWPDPQGMDSDPKEGFLNLVDRLSGHCREVAIATHDAHLARESLMRLRHTGTASELELLFGLPLGPCLAVARSLGVPVRIYLPFGHAWLPYVLSQAKRNPIVAWWVLRDLCAVLRARAIGSTHFKLPS